MNRNGDRPLVYDVVVVGGGPVGVAMAMACAHRGLSAVVLEKDTEVYDLPRAIVMDDEVQRALWLNGAGSGLAGVTSPLAGAEFVDTGGARIIGIDIPDGLLTPLGFPPVVRYYQPELEAFLRDRTIVAGARLSLGSEVTAIAQDDTSAWAMLRDGRRVEGRWLVAADGASSPIRKSLGIAFESQGFDQEWLVVDVRLRDGADPQLSTLVQQWCDPARPVTFVPGHDRYRRWEFQLQPGETREEMVAEERVWQLLGPWLTSADAVIVRAVVYRFHATVAERMRAGRVFLAGDAAHQTPPFLGQGLCALGPKLGPINWQFMATKKFDPADFEAVVRVHLLGSAWCSRAVLPLMQQQKYGRIVMTTSAAGLYGNFGQSNYGAAKLGVVGLMNSLKLEAEKHGIRVNTIAPVALTRMTEGLPFARMLEEATPERVSAGVAFLCSEACDFSGTILAAGAGYFSTVRIVEGPGVHLPTDAITPDAVAARWADISREAGERPFANAGAALLGAFGGERG